ncbi:hypothetical protein CVT26_004792 [Gymnopilus dilepis]|uniref:Uncharacterized protein n=1 Tax=Gymnopilus dilepis TaxID=231916 RepID=A0A409XZE5_9AGAR|nr:hypothetical protein CVT26_004792 [Gymnopilus dilepis]
MSLFEGASEFEISGGQFSHIAGNVYLGSSENARQAVQRLVEKDASLNQYSAEHGTLSIPRFSKSLLLRELPIDPDVGRISRGSCSFDLLVRLGLFPGQQNEALAEYDMEVPVDEVVSRGNCYCGRISRHGFIFLVSKYFQHASMAEATGGGSCIILSTSIGRFKCYEIEDRTFIHFDSGTRSSYVDLVESQDLDDILRSARGESLINGSTDNVQNKVFEWRRSTGEAFESIAAGQFYGVPKAIIYMTKPTIQRWKRLKEFAYSMISAVLSVLDGIREPEEFVHAMNNLPHADDNVRGRDLSMATPAEKLASCVYLYRTLSRKNVGVMSYESFNTFAQLCLSDTLEAHKHFRSPRVELTKLIETSHSRFLRILDDFQPMDGSSAAGRLSNSQIQRELQSMLQSNKNNVALVVFQGFLALLSQWNSSRVLSRAREAPDEWVRFVGADDDDLFIG